ncbi:unnamed protein product [Symbiodinium sp. CCMP2456]|nr:unnamed protein product [Symbiodinium sp. CCMP2456]
MTWSALRDSIACNSSMGRFESESQSTAEAAAAGGAEEDPHAMRLPEQASTQTEWVQGSWLPAAPGLRHVLANLNGCAAGARGPRVAREGSSLQVMEDQTDS